MAASRINYIASNFSYAPDLYKVNFMDGLTKFLVSGFGPWTVEKITVTDKVARVITTEKNFISIPGAKLSIAGTGVTAIDDRQELTEVYSDGFSFSVDTPNATFTNGVTYSVPSLGWSLVRQTAVVTIYKSSEEAVTPFYLIITKKPTNLSSYPDERFDHHIIQIAFGISDILEPRNAWPAPTATYFQCMPIHPYTPLSSASSYNTGRAHFFFYGDGAHVTIGADFGTTGSTGYQPDDFRVGSILGALSVTSMGESRGINNNIPLHYIVGPKVNTGSFYDTNRTIAWMKSIQTAPVISCNNGSASTFDDAYIGTKIGLDSSNSGLGGVLFPRRLYTFKSGDRISRAYSFVTNYNEINMYPSELVDNNGNRLGNIPGLYALDNRPGFIETTAQKRQDMTINNKLRRGFFMKGASTASNTTGGSSTTTDADSVVWCDLTGPIR